MHLQFLRLKGVKSSKLFIFSQQSYSFHIFFWNLFFQNGFSFIKIYVQSIHIVYLEERKLIEHTCRCLWKSFGLIEIFTKRVGKNICTRNTFSRYLENLSKAWKHTMYLSTLERCTSTDKILTKYSLTKY